VSEERLLELRRSYVNAEGLEARVIVELLDEIDVLDEALAASEDEVERLRAKVEPKAPSASVSKTASGKWAVRWREDGKQLSRTFERRAHAEAFRAEMRGRWMGGAR
jgi:hypothetical protein